MTDTTQLMNRINQLETQIQTLGRAVYRGEKGDMPAEFNAPSGGAVAAFESRMVQIEEQQRNLTGQIEKIGHDLQQLKSQVERMQADTDQRFSHLNTTPTPTGSSSSALSSETPSAPPMPVAGGKTNADSIYENAFSAIRDARYEEAEDGFKEFLRDFPSHTLAANARYWLGETYYVRGDFKQAAQTFAQGYQEFPKSAKAPDSLLKLGLSLSKLGRKEDACLSLQQLQKDFKGEAATLQARGTQEMKQLGCP